MGRERPEVGIAGSACAAVSLLSLALWSEVALTGQPDKQRAEVPPLLSGSWQTECNSFGDGRITFRTDAANLGPGRMSACRLVGLRVLGDRRWYLDFNCADAIVVELDVLQTSARQLLISARPLGEACAFTKDR